MARPVPWVLIFLPVLILLIPACGKRSPDVDISNIKNQVVVERFDVDLFGASQDSLDKSIDSLYRAYGDFFDVFNVHVINIGAASSRRYPSYLSMFINDPANREVFDYTGRVFRNMDPVNESVTSGFRHYLYYYPDSLLPRVIGYVSRFNQGLFTVDNFVGVGMDQYLGSGCAYYRMMGIPEYLIREKVPERIPVDVMMAWATRCFPYNDSVDNLLNRIIYKGMLTWFVDAMYPGVEDTLKMGYTAGQMKWCRNNEKQMWTYLVEQKLLFSTDPMVIRKLTEDAPYTQYFTIESPGRAAVWVGLQIVREYNRRNPRLSLPQVMATRDYQKLLRESRYNP